MSLQDLRKKIDAIMNVIYAGGLANHGAIIELMIYIIFLRELHKHDQEQSLLDDNYSPVLSGELAIYQWDNILSLNADALFTHLSDAFEKIADKSTNKTVKMLYNKAHVKLFAKPALRTVVHKIEEMMTALESEERTTRTDLFGDLYEYLLSKLTSAGTAGQFRTPRHLIKFIVNIIDPKAEESICDPACGTGGFLVAALDYLKNKYTSEQFREAGRFPMDLLTERQQNFFYNQAFTGFDSDPDMIKFGLMNLYFHKLENATIKRRNTLVDTQGETTKWDIILANPPFAGSLDRMAVTEELQMDTGATEVLFLNYMIRHLTDRGRCGVIVPEGVIFKAVRAHKAIRKKLVEEAGLWAVVSLPGGVFEYAGVKTSILFFDKTKKETNDEIIFIKITDDGFTFGANRQPHDKNDLPCAVEILTAWKEKKELLSSCHEGINPASIATVVEKVKIVESGDYNLSGDRYRETVDHFHAKWPIVELGDVCEIYQPKTITSKEIKESGEYKVFGANGVIGFYDKYNHEESEVAVTCRGATCGTVNFTEPKSWITGNAMVVKPKSKINKKYLYYFLRASDMISVISGAAQPQITRTSLMPFKIPLPPLEVQEKIVAELDGYQKIITGAKQIAENWKPKIDIDPEWEKVKFISICALEYGQGLPKKNRLEGQYPVMGSNGRCGFHNKYIINGPAIIIGRKGSAGEVVWEEDNCFPIDTTYYIKMEDEKYDLKFLFYILLQANLQELKGGAGVPGLNRNDVYEKITLPKLPLINQKQIVEKIEAERALVESAKKLIDIYEQKTKDVIAKLWSE